MYFPGKTLSAVASVVYFPGKKLRAGAFKSYFPAEKLRAGAFFGTDLAKRRGAGASVTYFPARKTRAGGSVTYFPGGRRSAERVRLTAQNGTCFEASAVRLALVLQDGVAGTVKNGEARSDVGSQSAALGNSAPQNLTLIYKSSSVLRFARATFPEIDGLSLSRRRSSPHSTHTTPTTRNQRDAPQGPSPPTERSERGPGPRKRSPNRKLPITHQRPWVRGRHPIAQASRSPRSPRAAGKG